MSRPRWPDSPNSLSEIPGTIHVNKFGTVSLSLNGGSMSMFGADLDGQGVRSDSKMILAVKGGSADGMALTFTR